MSDINMDEVINKYSKFADEEERQINIIRQAVKDKADYNLRQIISVSKRIKDKVGTGVKNEYGDEIEDWDRIQTKELINLFSEAVSWNFFSTPVRMNSFIESSLAEIIYKYEYNQEISDPNIKGTVTAKAALAEINTHDINFICSFRKFYTSYVTEVLKSFDMYIRRMEKIIDWRLQEERMKTKSPFN